MKIKVIVHTEETGYWAEVPAIPGCATQGNTGSNIKRDRMGCILKPKESPGD